jgi:hypothetical protein
VRERERRERKRKRERLKTTEDESDCIRQKTKRASSSSPTVCPPDFDKTQKRIFRTFITNNRTHKRFSKNQESGKIPFCRKDYKIQLPQVLQCI